MAVQNDTNPTSEILYFVFNNEQIFISFVLVTQSIISDY